MLQPIKDHDLFYTHIFYCILDPSLKPSTSVLRVLHRVTSYNMIDIGYSCDTSKPNSEMGVDNSAEAAYQPVSDVAEHAL